MNSCNYAQVIIILERSTECLLEDLHHHLIWLPPQSLWEQEEEEEEEDIASEIGSIWNTCCKSSLDYCNKNSLEALSTLLL
jgi:hypothetical protein